MKTQILIDAKNLLFRNAAVLQLSHGGQLTGGVHGFFRCLMNVYDNYPGHVTICWDDWENGPAERKALYPEYKKRVHNEKQEQLVKEVMQQQQTVFALLKALGIRQTRSLRWEADDVMGTLARKWDGDTVIYTGDRDLLQCVSDRVSVLRPAKNGDAFYRPRDVEKEFGVPVSQFVDYKALVGDPGDNIPGCNGIGPVAARGLLGMFKGIDDLYLHLDSLLLTDAMKAKLTADKDSVLLSRRLATINTHVELRHKRGELNQVVAKDLLKQNQMVQLLVNFSKLAVMRWHDDA